MENKIIKITALKFNGSISRSWNCRLISQSQTLFTFIGTFDEEINHPELGVIRRGTVSEEFFWSDRWFNIFRFQESDGTFRNFYCNICQPPNLEIEKGVLSYVDLDIDIIVDKDLHWVISDTADFEDNAVKYDYPAEIVEKVYQTVKEIILLIERREFPFNSVRS